MIRGRGWRISAGSSLISLPSKHNRNGIKKTTSSRWRVGGTRKAAKAAASGKGGLRAARSSAVVSAAAGEDADGKAAETRHVCTVLAQAIEKAVNCD